ncbi:glycosyl transferase family 2 [Reticulibacter mediterranei]|uniref:Glycosyl transferase family 2 n=1 Tax=Reticulibacter mediterranei TaxID=2778369 RepID=A0A8J3MZQ6_9CHLR|nr:glycosyltransferase family 2 protein [Reticulibacter mediterranei]GHO92152.1 glycosyl transferase family 2 [Reticulibacter mediterranei]
MHAGKAISVVICAYTEKRWDDLLAAVDSVCQQTTPAQEIIVVIDHNPALLQHIHNALSHITNIIIVENKEMRGLSGARNCGIKQARSPFIAFLDDDAVAAPDWLQRIQEGLDDTLVLGVGGIVIPLWLKQPASWFPKEFLWVVGCTYAGMPQHNHTIRNPIGANMLLRREIFEHVGGFHNDIGRVGTLPVGCEETELCIRARQHWPQGRFLYEPGASVSHRVPAQRTTWRYFCERCYAEGYSKALISKRIGSQDGLASERTYTLKTLPKGIMRGLKDTLLRRDFAGMARASAIIMGFSLTTIGYIVGYLL